MDWQYEWHLTKMINLVYFCTVSKFKYLMQWSGDIGDVSINMYLMSWYSDVMCAPCIRFNDTVTGDVHFVPHMLIQSWRMCVSLLIGWHSLVRCVSCSWLVDIIMWDFYLFWLVDTVMWDVLLVPDWFISSCDIYRYQGIGWHYIQKLKVVSELVVEDIQFLFTMHWKLILSRYANLHVS